METLDSTANDIDGLLNEILKYQPDTILLDESSPLSTIPCLVHLLKELPGRPIVVVSQEENLLHVIRWRTVQVEQANDLIEFVTSN